MTLEPIKQTAFEMYEEMVFGKKNDKAVPSNLCECGKEMEQTGEEHVCLSCGMHYGYEYAKEYINYYENLYNIRKKSIYKRKYYLEKVIIKYKLTSEQREEFEEYFGKIEDAYKHCTFYKKRMIAFEYLFRKVFEMMGLKKQIKMCKPVRNKNVLRKYEGVWKTICEHNGWPLS